MFSAAGASARRPSFALLARTNTTPAVRAFLTKSPCHLPAALHLTNPFQLHQTRPSPCPSQNPSCGCPACRARHAPLFVALWPLPPAGRFARPGRLCCSTPPQRQPAPPCPLFLPVWSARSAQPARCFSLTLPHRCTAVLLLPCFSHLPLRPSFPGLLLALLRRPTLAAHMDCQASPVAVPPPPSGSHSTSPRCHPPHLLRLAGALSHLLATALAILSGLFVPAQPANYGSALISLHCCTLPCFHWRSHKLQCKETSAHS